MLTSFALGGEDVDNSGGHIRYSMVAPPRDVGLQHRGRHQQLAQVHGPLVPHVRQDMHLYQQVERKKKIIFSFLLF